MYPTNRRAVVIELIEKLKQEFDGVLHESNTYKIQRDQYERKLQSQLNELANIHSTVLELEKIQKDQNQWRRQMDGVPPPTNSTTATTFTSQPNHMRAPPTDEGKVNAPFYGTKGEKKRTFEQTGGVDVRLAKRLRPNVTPLVHAPSYELQEDAKKADRRSFKPLSEDLTTKKDDWVAGGVSSGPQTLSVDLSHTMPHKSVVCCVRFSKDGKFLATGCNKTAQIFDAKTGVKLHTFVGDEAAEGDLYIRSVCFSPDGKYLATGAEDKTVRVWDTTTKTIHKIFVGHSLDIYALDFSNDGKFIVSGSGDKRAKIWSMEDSTEGDGCLHTLGDDETGPTDGVTSVAISPDGKLVAAGSLDRIVRLWDAKTGRFLERYEGHLDSVYSVAFSPDGKFLASGSLDKTLKLWDLSGSRTISRCISTFNGHKDFVLSVAFSQDGQWLVSGSKDRAVQFWDPRTAKAHLMLQGHKNSVISVAVSPSGDQFATGSGDFRARLWKYSQKK